MRRYWLAVVASGVWMNLSELIRNEFVIKHVWVKGFEEMELSFPSVKTRFALILSEKLPLYISH